MRLARALLLAAGLLLLPASAAASGPDGELMFVTGYAEAGVTASGGWTTLGVAACPRWMDFGTQFVVDGIGLVVCADRYSAALSDRLDVYRLTPAECFAITGMRRVWAVQ